MAIAMKKATEITQKIFLRYNQTVAGSQLQRSIPDVKGLSNNVVQVPNTPVGPGAAKSTDYKNPEYFCYNDTSYFEAEVEMAKYRLAQPSNKKK